MGFLVNASKNIFYKLSGTTVLAQKMSVVFDKAMMISPNSKNGNTILNKIFVGLRLMAVMILLVTIKLKTNLKN
jgi:hypothetical protein